MYLRVFSNVPGVFGNQQNEYLGVIKQMLQQSLMDAASPKVNADKKTSCFVFN